MSRNKFLLPIILLLLIITLPLGIYGLILHNQEVYQDSNPNKLHKFNGKLYYYSNSGNLLGTYTCTSSDCGDALVVTDDEYLHIEKGGMTNISNINDKFALVSENDVINLVSISNGFNIGVVDVVKNYGDISMPYIIMKKEGSGYSAFSVSNGGYVLNDEYDYVGYINSSLNNGVFSVKKDNKYYLVGINQSEEENILSIMFNYPIYYYTDTLIVINNNNLYSIYNYQGELILGNINRVEIFDNKIVVRNSYNKVFVYSSVENVLSFNDYDKNYDFEITDEGLSIISEGEQIELIEREV